jgi:polysaccharide deacetylase 2 family uncharacterized protein YibQ
VKPNRAQQPSHGCCAGGRIAPLFLLLVSAGMLGLSSCNRKGAVEPESREISREMIAAAERAGQSLNGAAGGGVKATLSSSPLATVPEERAPASVDVITIRLNTLAVRPAVEQALDNVAQSYGMVRTPESSSGNTVRWDYVSHGVPRQSIRLVLSPSPAAASAIPASAPPFPASKPAPTLLMKPLPSAAPRLAFIIDDLGYDKQTDDAALSLPRPLTVSVLPNLPLSREIATEAHSRGYQVILHLPMQPESNTVHHEDEQLLPGMRSSQVRPTVEKMLSTVPFAVGVNNHEGSRATSDPQLMGELMPALREKNLFFIDSRTSAQTVAYQIAQQDGVRSSYRKVFLDDTPTIEAVIAQIQLAERDAHRDGWAIAIGHPHPATIAALREELPLMQAQGIRLVFASDLVH